MLPLYFVFFLPDYAEIQKSSGRMPSRTNLVVSGKRLKEQNGKVLESGVIKAQHSSAVFSVKQKQAFLSEKSSG